MSQNQGNNNNADVLQHSSGIRNQPGGSNQGKSNRKAVRIDRINLLLN